VCWFSNIILFLTSCWFPCWQYQSNIKSLLWSSVIKTYDKGKPWVIRGRKAKGLAKPLKRFKLFQRFSGR
jgi:hypothetical protein